MGGTDRVLVGLELLVALNSGVADGWGGRQVLLLGTLVLSDDCSLLGVGEHEQLLLLLCGQILVCGSSRLDLILKDGQERVVLVLHDALAQAGERRLEEVVFDLGTLSWISKLLLNLGERLLANIGDQSLKVGLLVSLDRLEHVGSSVVEVTLESLARSSHEVDERSLLHEVVLTVDAHVLHLLLGGDEPLHLSLLCDIGPLVDELLALVPRVGVVEVGELGSDQEREVTHLGHTQVESNDVLVVEDHTTEPLVVRPAAHAGQRGDGTHVEEEEDETATRPRQRLVVRRDLLGADSLEERLHVSVIREADWVLSSVVGVLVTLLHAGELVRVETLSIGGLILSLASTIIG